MRIHVLAPSRTLPREAAALLNGRLSNFPSLELTIDDQCFLTSGHFAGPDDVRAEAFIRAANDPLIDAIWFARGGYGACRLLDRIVPQLREQARSKTYLGYSDGGFLLGALDNANIGQVVHGPMLADSLREGGEAAIDRVLRFLAGEPHDADTLQPSCTFNIAVLASLVAGCHCPTFDGRVVVLEEVAEHLYATDRALFTIFSSGILDRAKGVKRGQWLDVPENDIPFGETPDAIMQRWCDSRGVLYSGQAPVGHDVDNKIVPFR